MTTETELRPTNEGLRLVREFVSTRVRSERKRGEFDLADAERRNAEIELIKWLIPDDAPSGQTFVLPIHAVFLHIRIEPEGQGYSFKWVPGPPQEPF